MFQILLFEKQKNKTKKENQREDKSDKNQVLTKSRHFTSFELVLKMMWYISISFMSLLSFIAYFFILLTLYVWNARRMREELRYKYYISMKGPYKNKNTTKSKWKIMCMPLYNLVGNFHVYSMVHPYRQSKYTPQYSAHIQYWVAVFFQA